MAEIFLFDIAENVLRKITSFTFQQVRSAWWLETDLLKIQEMLLAIKAVLFDAEQRQAHSQWIQLWLQNLREVLYDAEDVLGKVEYEALRRQVVKSGSTRIKVRRFFSSSNPLAFRFRTAYEVKKIRDRMAEIAALKSDLDLRDGVADDRRVICREREMTHSFVDATTVIGRDEDKDKILHFLLNAVDSAQNVSILPIVGMGGLGKTALSKLVFNDEKIAKHFQKKVWVCVSDTFDLQRVSRKIVKSATGEKCEDWDIEQLQRFLRDTLDSIKYLLVLDDMWNEDRTKWLELKPLLMGGAKGSKIVVTTRSNPVASIVGSVPPYNLNDLSHEYCLSLFFKCAFKDTQQDQKRYPNLVKIGEGIVKKCKGVPLAVVSLGNSLYSTTDERDWKSVRDSEIWNLEETENGILHVLRISYERLPYYLKRCFAYCSFFPKDYEYLDVSLIQFWMAHGLLQSKNENEELEDIGSRYFKELYSRSFFQDFEEAFGYIVCKMHDLMHDLAMSLIQNECSIITSITRQISSSRRTVRHLLFANPDSLPERLPIILQDLDRVRTVAPVCVEGQGLNSQPIIQLFLSRFQYLRHLDLSYSKLEMLPKKIGTLKHLRFLILNFSRIKKLHNSFYKLHNLQTLWLVRCDEIKELPSNIRYLISLRALAITTKQKCLPNKEIGCLKSLRTLAICKCEKLEYLFEDMQGLTRLRALSIVGCSSLICLPECMKSLIALETLCIGDCENLNLRMEEEKETQFGLQKLRLALLPKLVDLPQWLLQGSTNTLQFLQLIGCPNIQELPACLSNLTSLQQLQIAVCGELGNRCKREAGQDWSKIAHIPEIIIDKFNQKMVDE